ncbi:MAG: DNA polymerase III subunit delta' [Mariprofundales bacterium]
MTSLQLPIGNRHIEQYFTHSIEQDRIHHAWLLHGAHGIGKFMHARWLAAAYLCDQRQKKDNLYSPCQQCSSCRTFIAGTHPDAHILQLQQDKRDLSIKQVREMLHFCQHAGEYSQRRVIIIDDAERLNKTAVNALLKIIEEPPAGCVFFLVCSDASRFPATLRSRCLLLPCSPLSSDECLQVLNTWQLLNSSQNLIQHLANGQPGRVTSLQDNDIAERLLAWQSLIKHIHKSDIGRIEAWLDKNASTLPAELICTLALDEVQNILKQSVSHDKFTAWMQLDEAALHLAAWPIRMRQQSLQAANSLLSCLLNLRLAMRIYLSNTHK